MHFASQPERRFIDVISQILINRIISQRLVNEEFVLHAALHIFHLGLQPIDLLILRLAPFHKLDGNSLRFLQLFLDLEQECGTILVLKLDGDLNVRLLLQSALKFRDARLLVFLSAQ